MHRITALAALALALTLTAPVASLGQEAAGAPATGMQTGKGMAPGQGAGQGHGRVCREAMQKLCPGLERGTPAFRECVFAKVDQLPEECRGGPHGPAGKGHGMAIASVCKAEIQAHCADVERGAGRMVMCLDQHKDALSKDCASMVDAMKARHAQRMGQGASPKPGAAKPDQATPDAAKPE